MVAHSKFVLERFSACSCNEVLHPHSCLWSLFQNIWRFTWSNGKYYLPVALFHFLKQLLNGFNLSMLQNSLIYYGQLIFGGMFVSLIIASAMCTFRNVLGEFRLYTLLFLPAVLGGIFTGFMPRRVKGVEQTAVFQSVIESLLLQRGNPLTKAIGTSRPLQTLIFMACSSIILLGRQRKWYRGFWFLASERSSVGNKEVSCWMQYVVEGMRKYMLIGLAVDTFKGVVSCVRSKHWHWRQFSLESMAWLGCYVGIYRALLSWLQGCPTLDTTSQQLVAGFMGGISYLCYPKLTILSYAMLEAGRTLWGKYCRQRVKKRIGYSEIIYPFALAYLIHVYVLRLGKINHLAAMLIDNSTANYGKNITKRLMKIHAA